MKRPYVGYVPFAYMDPPNSSIKKEKLKPGEKIHYSLAVYNNGDTVENYVLSTHLEDHIKYNCTFRPGRALIIDGICHNEGYLSKERIQEYIDKWKSDPIVPDEVFLPYR